MSLMITSDCTCCDACLPECPNEAIAEGDPYVIDPDRCTECVGDNDSPACAAVCPVDVCVPDPSHVESKDQLTAKRAKLRAEGIGR